MTQDSPYASAGRACDLVMKGGVTSGIVYVPMVLKLAKEYRLACVGGTSAGAIVAAYTVAAEYAREKGGFEQLEQLNAELTQPNFIQNLFQPSCSTAPLFDFLLATTSNPKMSWPRWAVTMSSRLITSRPVEATLAGLLASAVIWIMGGRVTGLFSGLSIGLVVFFALLAGAAFGLFRIFRHAVPRNLMGMCSGRRDDSLGRPGKVMIDWLHSWIQRLAARTTGEAPLTFGDLDHLPTSNVEGSKLTELKRLSFRLMTSNLTQSQPYVLPFDGDAFIFREDEFRNLFPDDIVQHLINKSSQTIASPNGTRERELLPAGFHYLPPAADFPIVVATRMSMSFPVLLSAVPLYSVRLQGTGDGSSTDKRLRLREQDLVRNWFSDGGICSNFPIQFFDGWLPSRPTFGANLTSFPPDAVRDSAPREGTGDGLGGAQHLTHRGLHDVMKDRTAGQRISRGSFTLKHTDRLGSGLSTANVDHAIYLPRADAAPITALADLESHGHADPAKFLGAIFNTAQTYRDTMQSALPSYRERIVNVRLADDEGGLNLAMDQATIQLVMAKGEAAGNALVKEFNMPQHQWVRFRVLMRQMQSSLLDMQRTMTSCPIYQEFMTNPASTASYPYPVQEQSLVDIKGRLEELNGALEKWNDQGVLNDEPLPYPDPVLRVTPEV